MSKWDEQPDSLWELCINFCVKHSYVFSDQTPDGLYTLKAGLTLPPLVSQSILNALAENGGVLNDAFLHLFKDVSLTKLKHIDLQDSDVTDRSLQWLMPHCPFELNISGCQYIRDVDSIHAINRYGHNLMHLFIGDSIHMFSGIDVDTEAARRAADDQTELPDSVFGSDYVFDCLQLRAFSLHGLLDTEAWHAHDIVMALLTPLERISYLDLSGCAIKLESSASCFENLRVLRTLILYNIDIETLPSAFMSIATVRNLRALDISQGKESIVLYQEPERNLTFLMQNLPYLSRLDLSGTNLPGFLKPQRMAHSKLSSAVTLVEEKQECAVPGLEGRQMEFLGLLGCYDHACYRENLPAKQVTGDANSDQVVLSVQLYLDKVELLIKALNHLFHIMRLGNCNDTQRALVSILAAMKKHPNNKHVQISGSASLFYIVKGEGGGQLFNSSIRRKIVLAILKGMENHEIDSTMMRNGCLTLCHFKIPGDVLFKYERLVRILLKLCVKNQEEFVQRISIYLLNSFGCQVEAREKQLIGELGAIQTMLNIIDQKLNGNVCDEVMEIAWSTMWNITDETPSNCELFLDHGGMSLFQRCLATFHNREELLRNMMGLMGNVAEVPKMRRKLMYPEYINVFSDLLSSQSDGIEVSYNACGVLAHLVSDGHEAWTCRTPSLRQVSEQMVMAISRWNLKTRRNINYRSRTVSFEPILRLVRKFNAPSAQHWAIWALCNLTKMYRKKYCSLLEREQGLPMLMEVLEDKRPYDEIKELVLQILNRCRRFSEDADYKSDDEDESDDHEAMEG